MKTIAASLLTAVLLAVPALAQETKPEPEKPKAPRQIQTVQTIDKRAGKREKPGAAPKQSLSIGDKAPELKVEAFIKGAPVRQFEKGKVYVVEFWSTWCGPCRDAFPHLSKNQAKYKDKVTFIGINIWEHGYNSGTLDTVKSFVEGQGDNMAYTVAFDGAAAAMDNAYMRASGSGGIPTAFIVDQEGRIAWIGHPVTMDDVLAQVVDGKYDMNAAKQKTDAIVEAQTRTKELTSKFEKALRFEKWDEALAALDALVLADPDRNAEYLQKKFGILLSRKKDYAAAYGMKDVLLTDKTIAEDARVLNELAWTIVRPDSVVPKADRNLDFAMTFAQKANDATNSENSMFVDTLARVYWDKGDHAKAIELQEKAIKAAEKDGSADTQKELLKATLDKYKKDDAQGDGSKTDAPKTDTPKSDK